jgi:membrane protease YdiL (CAAX protease family)
MNNDKENMMSTLNTVSARQALHNWQDQLQPLPAAKALIHFLLAGFVVRFSVYNIGPWLLKQGLVQNPFEAFIVTFTVPMALLFAAAFASAAREGTPENVLALAARFRLRPLKWRDLALIVLGLAAAMGSIALVPVRDWMISLSSYLAPPVGFPVLLDPSLQGPEMVNVIKDWIGPAGLGNLGYAFLVLLLYFFNTFGEELYWRGILLPRQEKAHGRRAWVFHGLMWAIFHVPLYPWYLIYILPLSLGLAFAAQKSGNTWVPILLHALQNLYMYGLLIGIIMGGP